MDEVMERLVVREGELSDRVEWARARGFHAERSRSSAYLDGFREAMKIIRRRTTESEGDDGNR